MPNFRVTSERCPWHTGALSWDLVCLMAWLSCIHH